MKTVLPIALGSLAVGYLLAIIHSTPVSPVSLEFQECRATAMRHYDKCLHWYTAREEACLDTFEREVEVCEDVFQ